MVSKKLFLHTFRYNAIPLSPISGRKMRFAGRTKVNKICVKLKGLYLKWEHKKYKKWQVVYQKSNLPSKKNIEKPRTSICCVIV